MALVPATLLITFTSDYAGCNRVCYRTSGSGGYTCVNVTCLGGGASCNTGDLIQISVDNETCPTIEFDGYVQACCEDVSSLEGRVPFSTTFVPSPSCKKYLVTCVNTPVVSLAIVGAGSGYTIGSHPTVGFSGGGGSGATATANVGTGFILTNAITFIGGGSGYVPNTYVNVPIDGGSGTGAQGTFTVSGGGVIIAGTITTRGNGYLNTDVLHPHAAYMGGNTSDAAFGITTDYGTITSIVLNTPGSGYTTAPVVTIAPPPSGTTATATANMDTCPSFTVTNCNGIPATIGKGLVLNNSLDFCSTTGGPTVNSQFSVSPDGNCLCSCEVVTITATGSSDGHVNVLYTGCDGVATFIVLNPGHSPSSFTGCIVSGSLLVTNVRGATNTVVYGGVC